MATLKQIHDSRETSTNSLGPVKYFEIAKTIYKDCSEINGAPIVTASGVGYWNYHLQQTPNMESVKYMADIAQYQEGVCGEAVKAFYNDVYSKEAHIVSADIQQYYNELKENILLGDSNNVSEL